MVGVGYLDTTGLAVGLKKGFLVEKRKLADRPASRKGVYMMNLVLLHGLLNLKEVEYFFELEHLLSSRHFTETGQACEVCP